MRTRPMGYYKSWENCAALLQPLIDELECYPPLREFKKRGFAALDVAIRRYHGGHTASAERIKAPRLDRPDPWSSWIPCAALLIQIRDELGRLPTMTELRERGHHGLVNALYKHHGGLKGIHHRLEIAPTVRYRGTLNRWENVEAILRPIAKELGHFPTLQELEDRNLASVANAIWQFHGGLNIVAQRLGFRPTNRDAIYWNVWANCETVLTPIVLELRRFPFLNELRERKLSGLLKAIYARHGGMAKAAKRMGLHLSRDQLPEELLAPLRSVVTPF